VLKWKLLAIVFVVGAGLGVGGWWLSGTAIVSRSAAAADDYSNIHPQDYLGPQACAKCHAREFDQWSQHPHRKMNQDASPESVLGDFTGKRVEYGTGHVTFDQEDSQYFMSLFEGDRLARRYRVTRTVGSAIEQMYIGVQTQGPEPAGHAVYSFEGKLPFGYWLERGAWLPELYFDSDRNPEPSEPHAATTTLNGIHRSLKWNQTCIYCHNTYPYQHRVAFGEGTGFPMSSLEVIGGKPTISKWGHTTPDKLVTLGISCESCHFGGREHVVNRRESRYVPTSSELKVHGDIPNTTAAATESAYVINSLCSQCHCAKISQYPNGAGTWNSREGLDLTSSACSSQLKCTDCHSPHQARKHGGLLETSQIINRCVECHSQYGKEEQRLAHTRHSATTGINCLDCHMPKIVQGLADAVRTHHISSPTEKSMFSRAAPNACNLCHLDQSARWTVTELNKGWGKKQKVDLSWLREYQDKIDEPLGEIWLKHRFPVIRLIAATAYSRSPLGAKELPHLLEMLNDSQAVNRMFGLFAVERTIGRRLTEEEYAPMAAAATRQEQVKKLIERTGELLPPPDNTVSTVDENQ